jgi:hypothetical protein
MSCKKKHKKVNWMMLDPPLTAEMKLKDHQHRRKKKSSSSTLISFLRYSSSKEKIAKPEGVSSSSLTMPGIVQVLPVDKSRKQK